MDDTFKEFEDYIYKNVPIAHFEFPTEDFDDFVSAARWAWSCLENLAKIFCQLHCDRKICSFIMPPPLQPDKKSEKKWYKVQRSFHRALSYLPQSWFNIEDCPSCAVVKAFANFPKLMKYSPVPPVVILKLSVVEGMKFIASEIKECSVPCCEIEAHIIDADYFEDEYVNDVRIRELALLKIDLNNLPTIPPWELFEMKNALNEGQKIVKYIYKLSHPDDSSKDDFEPENTNDKEDDEAFRLNYSNALASAIALRFLVRVRYYYPDVLKEEEARKLHDELITHFESAIKNDRLNYINKFYEQPDFEKLKNDDHMGVVFGLLLLSHPDITIIEDDSTENIQKSGEQLAKNLKFADKTVMETIKNLQSIMLFDCKIPKPYDDATFQEPNRFFYILTTYWRLCKTLILKILDQNVDYSSDLLLKLIINIRARIETCLSKLSDISELTEAKEPVLHLLDAIVSCEMRMDMNAVPEYTLGLVEKVDISIEQARLQLGSKIYSLTPIEEFFIEFVEDAISDYHKNSEIAFKGMLKHAQNIPEIKKMEDIESLKLEFPDQYKIINQMFEEGESPEVIEAVLSKTQLKSTTITKEVSKNNNNLDPSENTLLNYWTTDEGNVLKISTFTKGERDGEVSFGLNNAGEMTKQRTLMQILIKSKCITVGDIINSCYSDEMAEQLKLTTIVGRVRSLISSIRIKKLKKNGINPDIITPLGHDIEQNNKVYLKVRNINPLDDKHFESKTIRSYVPVDEISSDSDEQIDDFTNYNPDKHIDGIDDEIID